MGNPYPFPINFGSTDLVKTNIYNVAYIWDRNNGPTGGWRTTDGIHGDIFNGIIEPFQGFFIATESANPVFTFTEDAEDTSGNGDFYGRPAPSNFVRLELNSTDISNSTWITISEEGSFQRTKSDALELMPFGQSFALFGTVKDDTMFDIGHFPFENEALIPISVETNRPGSFTITATDLNIDPTLNLVFVDTHTGIELPLTADFSYTFDVNATAMNGLADTGENDSLTCSDITQMNDVFVPTAASMSEAEPSRFALRMTGEIVSIGSDAQLPQSISLSQNYPNPFNPTTMISFELPEASDVRLEVFNIQGQRMAVLVDEARSAGSHQVSFDASWMSSGVYIYRLQAGNQMLTRKMTLVK